MMRIREMKRHWFTMLTIILVLVGCQHEAEKDWTTPLHGSLREATRLRVRSGGIGHRAPDEEKTLLDLRDARAVAEVVRGIHIDPKDSGSVCAFCGDPTLEFYHDDVLILSLGFHHGLSLRWPDGKWAGDGWLTEDSAKFLVNWLAEHGVPGPRKEREESLQR
jgi:hypothetical protein